MAEQTTPEKKQKNNKALYWCLAIGIVGALCLPNEAKIAIYALVGTGILLAGLIGLARLRKKIDPNIKAADKANEKYNREASRAIHLGNASLEQGTRAMHARNSDEIEDALHYEELFADAAKHTYATLNPSPPKVNEVIDKLKKPKR